MRVVRVVAAFTLGVGVSVLAPGDEASAESAGQSDNGGFVSLFDGNTLDGWHVAPRDTASDWSIRDGAIVGHGSANRLSYLVWEDEDLTDFELVLRYRLPGKGNTGIEIRAQRDPSGKRPFEGYQADLGHIGIGANILGAWDFHFAKRKEPPCPRGTKLVIDENGKFHSSIIPEALTVADVRSRKWNAVHIIARGNHFRFFINGKLASEFTDNAKNGQLTHGAIGLQIHDKGMQVEFKGIRLKRLGTMVQSEERVPVGLQKQLLVDDYVIAERQHITRALGEPPKKGVVMKPSPDIPTDNHPDKPYPDWQSEIPHDFGYRTTVLWNERDEKFQMLYRASGEDVTGYAESEDGLHWIKPLMSTTPNGKSNLITYRGKTKRTFYEASFMIDPTVSWGHPEKYKAAYNPGNTMCAIAYSTDGIHWEGYNKGRSVTGRAADFHNQILWDPIARRYMLLTRTDLGTIGGKTEERAARIMAHEKGNDLLSYPKAWKTLATIAVDDPKGEETPAGVKVLQMESMTIWIYENVYFGLMHVLTLGEMTGASQDEIKVGNPHKRPETDVVDFYIGTSRDGVHFDKSWVYERKPFIERGGDGCFDKAMVHAASEIVTRGDEHWIYYAGIYQEHHSGFTSKKSGKIGLATLPLDRFIGQQAGDKPGTIVTKPFRLEGGRLEVNVDAHAGQVQVEILDADGAPIPGFFGKDAPEYQAVDDLRLKPAWKSKEDLSSLKGKVVQIRFRLRNARLYAFQINRENSGKYSARPKTMPQGKYEMMVVGNRPLTVRKRLDFNFGWRFIKEDVAGAQSENFDDSDWRKLDLPHDWSIEGPFRADLASGTGYLPGGIGWYRKTFRLNDAFEGRRVRIEFDGVYKHSEVWCNGVPLGKRPFGYASFGYDLTPHLKKGDAPNVIAVRVDHADHADSRWYTGSGIYRNVHLVLTNEIHVKRHGIFVTTPDVAEDRARVEIKTTVVNQDKVDRNVVLVNSIFGPEGELLAKVEDDVIVSMGGDIEVTQSIEMSNPLLWSPGHPRLYGLCTEIKTENEVVDDESTSFGIRYFNFDPDEGFSLNDEPMKIKGLCIHHDAGALGAAVPIQVWERRLRIFKELGCNTLRMSHNPPASNLLDLCDAMGFLVMDEAFDEWDGCKRKWVEGWNKGTPSLKGYGEHFKEWSEPDLREMILRDRNHPSIILWSIGNEIDYPNDPFPRNEEALVPVAERLVAIVKSLDTSRPVTAALASPETNLFADCLDVVGYNYHEDLYEKDHSRYPGRMLYGSENGKGLEAWLAVENNDFIAGLHLWTGIDFLGEAGSWPWRNSGAGLLDLAGFKKSGAFFWQSLWTDTPMVQLLLRQGKGDEAKSTMVCYTNCDDVELLRDGESLGEMRLSDSPTRVLHWQVPSEEGVYSALGKRQGEVVCSVEWRAPGEPDRFLLTQDKETLLGDGRDVAHIEVMIVDSNGTRVADAGHEVTCSIRGPAKLIGMESGDARSHEDYKSNRRKAYRGRLLLYVQSDTEPGKVEVSLSAEGLPSATAQFKVENAGIHVPGTKGGDSES